MFPKKSPGIFRQNDRLFSFRKQRGHEATQEGGTDVDISQNRPPGRDAPDEELIDALIAVSVVAKRLAEKLRKQSEKEKALRCSRCRRGAEGRVNGGFHYE